MRVDVLRLGHRRMRDARITTHVCLTARALGARSAILSGDRDQKLVENVEDLVKRWGGDFEIRYQKNWEKVIEDWKKKGGEIVHLTMYGEPVQEVVERIGDSSADKLVVVGGSRVPSKVYQCADWNVSVTNQPHSEVAALAIFLHILFNGQELELEFPGGEMEVLPSSHGKRVLTRNDKN